MNAPTSPVTARFDEEHRSLLDRLAVDSSVSEVLREGVQTMAASRLNRRAPLYSRLVSEPEIDEAVEEAVSLACQRLGELFSGPVEANGISSNFQGLLGEHVRAMLMGREAAPSRGYSRALNALVGDEDSFGRIRTNELTGDYGFTVVRHAAQVGEEDAFYDEDYGFVPLKQVGVGALYTSADAAVRAVFNWMNRQGVSPRGAEYKVCALGWSGDGPVRVITVAY